MNELINQRAALCNVAVDLYTTAIAEIGQISLGLTRGSTQWFKDISSFLNEHGQDNDRFREDLVTFAVNLDLNTRQF